MDHLKLERTMSLTDLNTSSAIQDTVQHDLTLPADRSKHRFFAELPRHDFILPSLTRFDQDFRKFLLSALVDFGLMDELEISKCLNWCPVLPKFLPLQTLGDGNCLMHAVSQCMWAVQDRRLILRKSVFQVLIEDQTDEFRKRWQLEQEKHLEEQNGSPVNISNEEWNEDWKKTVNLASTTKSPETNTLNSLEEIHIFALANILRRPILVLCDDVHRGNLNELLADVNLGGIYLPLLCDSVDCVKSPLVIGYNQGHFMALVTTEDGNTTEDTFGQTKNKNAIPLVKYDNSAMQLHFLLPEECQNSERLLREYLNCSKVEYTSDKVTRTILVATMESQEPEAHLNKMFKTYFGALQRVYLAKLTEKQLSLSGETHRSYPAASAGSPTYAISCGTSSFKAPYPSMKTSGNKNPTCCSVHKRCKNIVCKNLTSQEYCHECRKTKAPLCTSPGCSFTANPDYEGLCSVCFTRLRALVDQGPHMVTPSAPLSNKCSNDHCEKEASPHLLGKCRDCYINQICSPNLENINLENSYVQQAEEPVSISNPKKPSKGLPGQTSPRLTRQNSRLFCINQSCNNMLEIYEHIYCQDCLTSMPTESRTEKHTNVQQPSTTIYEVCSKPSCNLPAVTYHGQLCLKHYKDSISQYSIMNTSGSQEIRTKHCLTKGCKYFGIPEHNYLCSECHAKALQEQYDMDKIKAEQDRAQAEWITQVSHRRHEQCQGCAHSRKPFYFEAISSPSKSFSAPPSPKSRKKYSNDMVPCVTKGCPSLGFKETQGLCMTCFKKQEMLLSQGSSKRHRFPSSP